MLLPPWILPVSFEILFLKLQIFNWCSCLILVITFFILTTSSRKIDHIEDMWDFFEKNGMGVMVDVFLFFKNSWLINRYGYQRLRILRQFSILCKRAWEASGVHNFIHEISRKRMSLTHLMLKIYYFFTVTRCTRHDINCNSFSIVGTIIAEEKTPEIIGNYFPNLCIIKV